MWHIPLIWNIDKQRLTVLRNLFWCSKGTSINHDFLKKSIGFVPKATKKFPFSAFNADGDKNVHSPATVPYPSCRNSYCLLSFSLFSPLVNLLEKKK